MLILYDLQQALKYAKTGAFAEDGPVSAREYPPSRARIEQIEDAKTIRVFARASAETGLDIDLQSIPGLMAGDRITITGRVGTRERSAGKTWSVALIASEPEDGQITQHTAPDILFSLTHTLEEDQLGGKLYLHTVYWGNYEPVMDLFIDSVLVTRMEAAENIADTRDVIYTLDPGAVLMGSEAAFELGRNAPFIFTAGYPNIKSDGKSLHITNRFNDWDGLDINLSRMSLRAGNQYKITVEGRIDGEAPEDATIMLQGIPGHSWKQNTPIKSNGAFKLSYTLSRTEIEKWHTMRIATNTAGASVPFFIDDIVIKTTMGENFF